MNPLLLLGGGAGAILVAALFLFVIPARIVRGTAISVALFVLTFGANITAPGPVWQGCMIAAVALLALALLRTRAPLAGGKRFVIVAAWWGYVALGALLADSYTAGTLVLYLGLAILAAYVVSSLDAAEVRMLYAAIILTATFQMVVGAAEVLTHAEPVWGYRGAARENPFLTGFDRAQGTMGHPIPFSVLQGLAFIVAWSNLARWKQGWRLLALASASAGLVVGGTRSVLLSVAGAVLFHLASSRAITSWLRTLYVLGAGLVVLLNIDVGIARIVEELLVSGSWTHRLGAFESVPNLLARPPIEAWFGHGFGNELLLYDRGFMQQTYLRVVDDMFVYALGTMGIVGVLALLGLCVSAFVLAGRTARALLVMMVGMFFSFDLFVWMYTGIVFSMIVTLPKAEAPAEGLKAPGSAPAALSA